MKLKFEEAISVPEYARRSIADSIDYQTVGMLHFIFTAFTYSIILETTRCTYFLNN